jgi:hypothetical protein
VRTRYAVDAYPVRFSHAGKSCEQVQQDLDGLHSEVARWVSICDAALELVSLLEGDPRAGGLRRALGLT